LVVRDTCVLRFTHHKGVRVTALPRPAAAAATRWVKVIDQGRCIGCHACTVACKAEHDVPVGVTRTYVKQVETGRYPSVSRHFQVTRCNQCEDPPCVPICPVTAMFVRPDGIVDFDREVCIGCKACMAACPYDAIYISPESHSAEKCNFCAHRIDQGLEPACVAVCPVDAILVGDIGDPDAEVSRIIARGKVDVRRPEKGTSPKLYYASDTTFARQVRGSGAAAQSGGFWGELPAVGPQRATSPTASMAAAMIAYDIPHHVPWDWKVSLYTWTKSIAAGAFAVPALFLAGGASTAATLVALLFLALTGGLLVADLSHPERFLRVLTRPQWKSWLTRGAYFITLYGLALALALLAPAAMRWPGIVLAGLTAVYTAFLFAQSRGRDLWQNPLLPLHFLAQALLAGGAVAVLLGADPAALAVGLAAHLAFAASEWLVPHPTADGARAFHNLVRGTPYRVGLALTVLALLGAWALPAPAAVAGLLGLLLHEHAYVQAGQSVPLS
jgi:Fe-S-cluster-containing dehydrogenase component